MQTEFKTETHLHIEDACTPSDVTTEDMLNLYKKEGFKTIIITPHYNKKYFDRISPDFDERKDFLLGGYYKAKELGEKMGLNILLGVELTLTEGKNEYLIYGVNETFLRMHPNLYDLSLSKLVKICRANDFLIVQAHPFRRGQEPAPLDYQMPLEVFNGRHVVDPQNELVEAYAKENGLIGVSGTDFHEIEDYRGGIITKNEIKTIDDFKQSVFTNDFRIIKTIAE